MCRPAHAATWHVRPPLRYPVQLSPSLLLNAWPASCTLAQEPYSLAPMTPPSGLPTIKLVAVADLAAYDQWVDDEPDSPCTPRGAGTVCAVPNAPLPPKLLGS